MCDCIKEVEQKFKDNFGYDEVSGPVEMLSGRAYLSFEVKEKESKKTKSVPMMLSKCPICGKEYAENTTKEDGEEDVSNETIGISDCRDLRKIVNSLTAGTMINKAEYLQIMMLFASVVERLEMEGQVSKE